MRRPEGQQWAANLVKDMKGTPHEPVPGKSSRHIPAFANNSEEVNEGKAVFLPVPQAEQEIISAYIYKEDITEHGPTPKYPGCTAVIRGGRYRAKHNDACRKRLGN